MALLAPANAALKVVGIDPGSLKMGFGVLEDRPGKAPLVLCCGALAPKAELSLPARLLYLFEGLREILSSHGPSEMALENVFAGRNVKTAFILGQARGVAMLAAAEAGINVFEYAPTTVKKAVVGSGASAKAQVRHMVCRLLELELNDAPLDVSDALSLAICHLNSRALYMRGLL